MASVLVDGRPLRCVFSKRDAPVSPHPVDSAARIALVTMLEPAIAFSSTFMSGLFLMRPGCEGCPSGSRHEKPDRVEELKQVSGYKWQAISR